MKHFALTEWADFARGLVDKSKHARMESHLGGCAKCREMAHMWSKVTAAAARETGYEPPADAVEAACNFFRAEPAEPQESLLERTARLIFDSFRQPLPQGVRGAARPARQLVFQAGSISVDLRVEARGANRLVLVGQVLDAANPAALLGNVAVGLYDDDRALAVSMTDRFGEFLLEFAMPGSAKLTVSFPDRGSVVVPSRELSTLWADA